MKVLINEVLFANFPTSNHIIEYFRLWKLRNNTNIKNVLLIIFCSMHLTSFEFSWYNSLNHYPELNWHFPAVSGTLQVSFSFFSAFSWAFGIKYVVQCCHLDWQFYWVEWIPLNREFWKVKEVEWCCNIRNYAEYNSICHLQIYSSNIFVWCIMISMIAM